MQSKAKQQKSSQSRACEKQMQNKVHQKHEDESSKEKMRTADETQKSASKVSKNIILRSLLEQCTKSLHKRRAKVR